MLQTPDPADKPGIPQHLPRPDMVPGEILRLIDAPSEFQAFIQGELESGRMQICAPLARADDLG